MRGWCPHRQGIVNPPDSKSGSAALTVIGAGENLGVNLVQLADHSAALLHARSMKQTASTEPERLSRGATYLHHSCVVRPGLHKLDVVDIAPRKASSKKYPCSKSPFDVASTPIRRAKIPAYATGNRPHTSAPIAPNVAPSTAPTGARSTTH
jgi:hypothetical protein